MQVDHVAIIGLGSIGRRHLRTLREIRPEIQITIVRSGYGADYPELDLANNVVHSLSEAIDLGIQAAIISSPATEHVKQGVELARAGIHLLIEKPISHSLIGVEELLNAVSTSKVVGLIGYILRYDPVAIGFKEFLDDGRLGQLLHVRVETSSYLPDWRPGQDYTKTVSALADCGGGVLLELSHEFDYIGWFFGRVNNIFAKLHNSRHLDIDVEECADIIMNTNDNVPVSLHIDFHQHHPTRFCFVAGSKGSAKWDAMKNTLSWHPAGKEIEVVQFSFERDELFKKQLLHFFSCIEDHINPLISLEDAFQTLKIIEAARKADSTSMRQDIA